MESDDFYITLPSNSSLKHFPDNTLSSFKVLLPRRINLSSEYDWEVGLSEIQYPLSLKAVSANGFIIIGLPVEYDEEETESSWNPFESEKYQVIVETPQESVVSNSKKQRKYFHYTFSPDSKINQIFTFNTFLINFINSCEILKTYLIQKNILSQSKAFSMTYDEGGERQMSQLTFTLSTVFEDLSVTFSPDIARTLGFPANDNQLLHLSQPGIYQYMNQKVDLIANRPPLFFVYNNIVAPSLIGDFMAPILRSVLLPRENKVDREGKYVSKSFSPINYHSVALKSFNIIETELRSQTGEKIPFEYGVVNVILHCRRRLHRRRDSI